MRQTRGSETSQYPEEKKSNEIPSVAASERGRAQTDPNTKHKKVPKSLSAVVPKLWNFWTMELWYLFFVLGSGL